MIQKRNCILVYSDMNTWIDFCILVSDEDFNKSMEVIAKAYDDWWELSDVQFEPLADWVSRCLTENDIEFEIYFKNEEEDWLKMCKHKTKKMREFEPILKANGYREIRSNGSHFIYSNGATKITVNKDLNKMVRERLIKENNLVER